MNITRENIDALNVVLKMKVEKADYTGQVEKVLKDYRKKANIKGFRPGMAPMSMIKKMYGTAILVDEVNKLVGEKLNQYLTDEKIEILGEPLPSKTQKNEFDPENQEDFEFVFDLGLRPEFEVKLSKRDKLPYYTIKIDDDMVQKTVDSHTSRTGKSEEADTVIEKDLVRGDFQQLDQNNNPLEDGIVSNDTLFAVDRVNDESIRNLVIGAKKDDIIDIDIKKAFTNDADLASMLRVDKEVAQQLAGNFRFTIKRITRHIPAPVNQELWDNIYGPGTVSSDDEYKQRIIDDLKQSFIHESDFRLSVDAKEKLVDKAGIKLPDDFMKRWLLATNEKLTAEEIEKDYAAMSREMAWQLIKNKIAEEQSFKLTAEEVLEYTKKSVDTQFKQYGMTLPDEQLETYAKSQMQNEETRRKMMDQLFEEKIIGYLKDTVKLDEKEVTVQEFNELFTKN